MSIKNVGDFVDNLTLNYWTVLELLCTLTYLRIEDCYLLPMKSSQNAREGLRVQNLIFYQKKLSFQVKTMIDYVVFQKLITQQRLRNSNYLFLTPSATDEDDEEMPIGERRAEFEMDMTALEFCDYENHSSTGGVPKFFESTMNTISDM